MSVPSVAAVYLMGRRLAERLTQAAADGRSSTAAACVTGLTEAATAIAADVDRVSADEVRAANRLRTELAALDGQACSPPGADVVKEMVARWFGPQGLPAADVGEFDRLVASLRGPGPQA
ncbi:hypothetical protein [Limnoglobus roseus]|uniref:Uncharacterized protein n=1 Tax=Limnoglobus roseus TaxID=2598579 RepID=A0A5C1ALL5_9BACT|nr:hypothetical protein [Limnoglobus roseus]QEL18866.1 hypothetical protein PX52LOC_05908 [Limnoglobus roseus]